MGWRGPSTQSLPSLVMPAVLGALTNVRRTFSHHVLVVVDTGVGDSSLGFIRGDNKQFLQGRRGQQA